MAPTRREFLKASLGASTLLSLTPAVPAFLGRSALAAGPRRDAADTVLVVVQLAGGNDGLNTVVPYADDNYAKNRRTLRLPENRLHKIDSLLGFHPRMPGFSRLFQDGHLSVVQGVGYPNPDQDHARAMRNWHTARPDQPDCRTGWLGRAIDAVSSADASGVPGLFAGRIAQPPALTSESTVVPSVRSLEECTFHPRPALGGSVARRAQSADENPLLDFVDRTTLAAYAATERIEAVARTQDSPGAVEYPDIEFAQMLRVVAGLIRADVGIRIYYTELGGAAPGGFDNHANQLGNHCALLGRLSESVAAFLDDLDRDNLLDRVLLMTFSEFGRTLAENGRRGTGHGSAAPMFLAGGKVAGGLVGKHPSLADLELGSPKPHTDFRRVYATALDRWLKFDSEPALGDEFKPIDGLVV